MSTWINPKYRSVVESWERQSGAPFQPLEMGNCSNCGGTGRHIYMDSDGTMKDIPCGACGGSGQTA